MRYLSVCSGIGADAVAWHPLGWECVGFSEVDKHASAVLKYHYPNVPNLGDFTKIGDDIGPIDLISGGTPCQAFSVAGLKRGMDDERGNLSLEFCKLLGRLRPTLFVWENVPGVFSSTTHESPDIRPAHDHMEVESREEVVLEDRYEADESHAFSCILAGFQELGYGFAYRVMDVQYVRTQSHPYACPQRRRRVFVVGYLGDWRPPAAILLEPEGLRGDHPPRREKGKRLAEVSGGRTQKSSGDVSPALTGNPYGDHESREGLLVSGAISRKWAKGTGGPAGDECYNLVCFDARQADVLVHGDKSGPLDRGFPGPAIATEEFNWNAADGRADESKGGANTLRTENRVGKATTLIVGEPNVRRLTPLECERLMGLPDGYTAIPYNGKPLADGARYKMLGNSIGINCLTWISERIDMFRRVTNDS